MNEGGGTMGIPFKGWERFLFHNSHMHECMGGVWFVFSSFCQQPLHCQGKDTSGSFMFVCSLGRSKERSDYIKYSARIIKLVAAPTLPLFCVRVLIQNVYTYTTWQFGVRERDWKKTEAWRRKIIQKTHNARREIFISEATCFYVYSHVKSENFCHFSCNMNVLNALKLGRVGIATSETENLNHEVWIVLRRHLILICEKLWNIRASFASNAIN